MMCYRYFLEQEAAPAELQPLFSSSEVIPDASAPILLRERDTILAQSVSWGYPNHAGGDGGLLVHARAETAEEKNLFRKSLYTRRCVIPTSGFCEQDSTRREFCLTLPETRTVYLAGLYNDFGGERRFLLLTAPSHPSMHSIRGRMPVILYREWIEDWLFKLDLAIGLLHLPQPALRATLTAASLPQGTQTPFRRRLPPDA